MLSGTISPISSAYDHQLCQKTALRVSPLLVNSDGVPHTHKPPRLCRCPSGCQFMFGVHIGPAPPQKQYRPCRYDVGYLMTADGGVFFS
ncbi:MAG: hypothetical protein E7487_07005 [Ruminococcaceae bacterium]|nr:hypothetical protein [Oscillospiraceae bacterium]